MRDERPALFVAEGDGLDHGVFGDLAGARLDHQHRVLGPATTRSSVLALELGEGRVDDELAVDAADAHGAERPIERDPGERERRRGAVHRQDVGVVLLVRRDHQRDELDLVAEALGEERPERAVDQAAR